LFVKSLLAICLLALTPFYSFDSAGVPAFLPGTRIGVPFPLHGLEACQISAHPFLRSLSCSGGFPGEFALGVAGVIARVSLIFPIIASYCPFFKQITFP
jgi:hypothetical protein